MQQVPCQLKSFVLVAADLNMIIMTSMGICSRQLWRNRNMKSWLNEKDN